MCHVEFPTHPVVHGSYMDLCMMPDLGYNSAPGEREARADYVNKPKEMCFAARTIFALWQNTEGTQT